MTWQMLEAIYRNYQEFRELYQRTGIDEITLDGGIVVNIHDVLRGIDELPKRQRQAVILMCLRNLREVDTAKIMGFQKWSSPVSSYKRLGLTKIADKYWNIPPDAEEF